MTVLKMQIDHHSDAYGKTVFDGTKLKSGATISCVGTYEPHKHELDPAVLPRTSKIICDSKEAALSETGIF